MAYLRTSLQPKANGRIRSAGTSGIARPSTPGQLLRRVPQVRGELRKGRDVPPARRILEADHQLLTERPSDLHERLH